MMSNSSDTDLREMCYEGPKLILEDVADNLSNEDTYCQQGGDMVRLGGLDYSIEPDAGAGFALSTCSSMTVPVSTLNNQISGVSGQGGLANLILYLGGIRKIGR
jgi:hypothetical protein